MGTSACKFRTFFIYFFTLSISLLVYPVAGDTVQLTQGNIDNVLKNHDVVIINFYADWCRFSQILSPIFEQTSDKIKAEFPQLGKVAFGKVDCDRESGISGTYRITKYPTLKVFRQGQIMKKEYRGQRSIDGISEYMRQQLKDSIEVHTSMEQIDELTSDKRNIIGYFERKDSENYNAFAKVSQLLRDDCEFHAAFGTVSEAERTSGDSVVFRPPKTTRQDEPYTGQPITHNYFVQWARDKCVPLVREITFENAEELTEEGLPFLILFHHSDDADTPKRFQQEVYKQLLPELNNINFLTADGVKFTHPLMHLGKTVNDLPILTIDSFRHMYTFPHDVKTDLDKPGLLKQFIADLHSGKLHREYHHGPDSTTQPEMAAKPDGTGHIPHDANKDKPKQPTSPPESTFKKLAPSRNRYTLLRDEL